MDRRYARQVSVIGKEGQEQLKESTVFLAGAGGLGSPVAIYLAAAGIGHLRVSDCDRVEESNLNRQILHRQKDIGRLKVESAKDTLLARNFDLGITLLSEEIDDENAEVLVGNASVIVDALDRYPPRFTLNNVAVNRKIPLVHGAIRGLYGQVTSVVPGEGPCLQCIYGSLPPVEEEIPALGPTAGVIGSIQAGEVIKCLTGTGRLLAGRMLVWDGKHGTMDEIRIEKNPSCRVCGGEGE
ncbi:MAG: HesA/MoeB/ThiF family protein [Methanomicrobiaceae archaeon]|nr:HesA/MoeB/ThiF family protein [Methanomicrobiaceae archaeon]